MSSLLPVNIQIAISKDSSHFNIVPELTECNFKIACDVTNPLCGTTGATYIYGPQKGVTVEMRDALDADLAHFAEVTKAALGTDFAESEGAGAAGGLGFAFLSYLKADLQPGIDLVLDAVEMEKAMEGADLVITGEGRLDEQTAMGKGPVGIAKLGMSSMAHTQTQAMAMGADEFAAENIETNNSNQKAVPCLKLFRFGRRI